MTYRMAVVCIKAASSFKWTTPMWENGIARRYNSLSIEQLSRTAFICCFSRVVYVFAKRKTWLAIEHRISLWIDSWSLIAVTCFSWKMDQDHSHHMHHHHPPMDNVTAMSGTTAMPSGHDHHNHGGDAMGDTDSTAGHALHHMMEMAVSSHGSIPNERTTNLNSSF